MLDIHCHVIPTVDDGAADLEEALALLRLQKQDGAQAVIATPHLYPYVEDVTAYFETVEKQYELLRSAAAQEDLPALFRGFEIRYFKGIVRSDMLPKLTLGGTRYLLVELPYGEEITDTMLQEIEELYYSLGFTPILAHIERYAHYPHFQKVLDKLQEEVILAHINASSLTVKRLAKPALRLLREGYISFMASDTHSVADRPPQLREGFSIIENKLGKEYVDALVANSEKMYHKLIKERLN